MKRFIFVCALVALALPALAGDDPVAVLDTSEQTALISQYNRQMEAMSLRMNDFNGRHGGNSGASRNALTRLRRHLAQTWQTLGLSPPAARTVAWAYRPRLSPDSQNSATSAKTDKQFATLIQSSLASKDYQLANQTLIDFVTKKIKRRKDGSPDISKR
jgi:hypothetical protein